MSILYYNSRCCPCSASYYFLAWYTVKSSIIYLFSSLFSPFRFTLNTATDLILCLKTLGFATACRVTQSKLSLWYSGSFLVISIHIFPILYIPVLSVGLEVLCLQAVWDQNDSPLFPSSICLAEASKFQGPNPGSFLVQNPSPALSRQIWFFTPPSAPRTLS